MPGLPPDVYRDVRRVLMDYPAFESNWELRELFLLGSRISLWRNRVPGASSRQLRAGRDGTAGECGEHLTENALVLLLQVLCDLAGPTDSVRPNLYRLPENRLWTGLHTHLARS
jgi:hypothetical protein